ncbi:MAG: hypothetical protein QOG74_905, partial [Alphaproteobacteria bacterium]|nr:hypothetical protein [Alphaproteobacteria bacterium]
MAPAYLGFKLQDSQLQFLVLPPFGAPAENDRDRGGDGRDKKCEQCDGKYPFNQIQLHPSVILGAMPNPPLPSSKTRG